MPVVRSAEAPIFTLPGVRFNGLTAPSQGASELSAWHMHVAPHTSNGEPHWLDHEEVFVVVGGALDILVNGVTNTLYEGDAISVPAGAHIQAGNSNDAPAHAVVCIPAGTRATMVNGQEIGTPPWAQ
ncbi:MAG: cupin domain-containing protein [Ktedonobacterales bacterium]